MRRSELLNELYQLSRDEQQHAAQLFGLERALETTLLSVGRFDFEHAATSIARILELLARMPGTIAARRLMAECLSELANIRRDQGKIDGPNGAFRLYIRARSLWQELGERRRIAEVTFYLGACNEMRKKYTLALQYYTSALEICEAGGNPKELRGRILLRMGTVLTKSAALNEADSYIEGSIVALEASVSEEAYGLALQKRAILQREKHQLDQALRTLEDVVRSIAPSEKFRIVQVKILTTDFLLEAGDEDSALKEAVDAEALAMQYDFAHQLSSLHAIINKHTGDMVDLSVTTSISLGPRIQNNELFELFELMCIHLTETEVREVCRRIGIELDSLSGESQLEKAESFVARTTVMNRTNDAIRVIRTSMNIL